MVRSIPNFIDLTGMRYGKLTVLKQGERFHNKITWECQCDCGNKITVLPNSLRTGNTKSCGCLSGKHGGTKTRLYVVWCRMMDRCYKPYVERYKNYGGRGIIVCDEWHDFANFREWAIASGYDQNAKHYECTLDRIDVNGNYCPSNCRWISMNEQMQNTTRTHYIIVNGERMNLTQASKKYNISVATLWARLNLGWSPERAVTETVKYGRKSYERIQQRS